MDPYETQTLYKSAERQFEKIRAIKEDLKRRQLCANKLHHATTTSPTTDDDDEDARQKARQLCADILVNVDMALRDVLSNVGDTFGKRLPTLTTAWSREFDAFDEQLRVIRNVDEAKRKSVFNDNLRRFRNLSRQWTSLSKIIVESAPKLANELAHVASLASDDDVDAEESRHIRFRPEIESCLHVLGSSELLRARQLLRDRRFLLLDHPGPLVRRDKRGKVVVASMDKSFVLSTALARGSVDLYESPDADDHRSSSSSPPASPASSVSTISGASGATSHSSANLCHHREKLAINPEVGEEEGVVTLHFNGSDDVTKIRDGKRTQSKGASSKLYHLRILLKTLSSSDAGIDDELFQEVILESRTFGIISNTSQEAEPMCALFWRRFFGPAQKPVFWKDFFDQFSAFFEEETGRGFGGSDGVETGSSVSFATGSQSQPSSKHPPVVVNDRPLTGQEGRIYQTLAKDCDVKYVTRAWLMDPAFGEYDEHDANYDAKKKSNPFSRWKYLYSYVDLLKDKYGPVGHEKKCLTNLWQNGLILGFVNPPDWRRRNKPGNCLLRFGNSQPARIVFTFWVRAVGKKSGVKSTRLCNYFFSKRSLKEQKVSPINRILQESLPRKGDAGDYVLEEDFRGSLIHVDWPNRPTVVAYGDLEEKLRPHLRDDENESKARCSDGYVTGVSSNEQLWPLLAEQFAKMRLSMDGEEEEEEEMEEEEEEEDVFVEEEVNVCEENRMELKEEGASGNGIDDIDEALPGLSSAWVATMAAAEGGGTEITFHDFRTAPDEYVVVVDGQEQGQQLGQVVLQIPHEQLTQLQLEQQQPPLFQQLIPFENIGFEKLTPLSVQQQQHQQQQQQQQQHQNTAQETPLDATERNNDSLDTPECHESKRPFFQDDGGVL